MEHQKDTYIIKGNTGSIQPTKESTVHTIEALYITHKQYPKNWHGEVNGCCLQKDWYVNKTGIIQVVKEYA